MLALDPDTERGLRRAAEKQREWTERRNTAIREAVAAGGSYREVATAVDLSHAAVAKIVKRPG